MAQDDQHPAPHLSPAQVAVLRLLARGYNEGEALRALHITLSTHRNQLQTIRNLLGAHRKEQLIVAAIYYEYVTPEEVMGLIHTMEVRQHEYSSVESAWSVDADEGQGGAV